MADCDPPAADLPRAAFTPHAFDGVPEGSETNANVPVSSAAGVDPCPDVALTGSESAATVEAQVRRERLRGAAPPPALARAPNAITHTHTHTAPP